MDKWMQLLRAAVAEDRASCIDWSLRIGYLTGEENEVSLLAHCYNTFSTFSYLHITNVQQDYARFTCTLTKFTRNTVPYARFLQIWKRDGME